ncbi:MAG: glycosyltransferase family 2 protein, partial [Oligoflexia bacterium]|nr:glycosyltransferase family 2 protein [Oligoflexia bacterium]
LEDVDLSRRIHSRYKTLYYPDVKIIHEHRKGSYTSRGLMGCHVLSAIRYFNKWGWVFDAERKKINRRAFFRVS